jgi:hypothetical protein
MARVTRLLLLLSASLGTGLAALDGSRYLWYKQPAIEWERGALPIGNGRMGGTVLGGLDDVLTVSEDTIWSGPIQDRTPRGALAALNRTRELFLADELVAAGDLVMSEMNSPAGTENMRQFSYFGNLNLEFGHEGAEVEDYIRWLDTKVGNTGVSYTYDGVNYTREYIASFPADVLAARFEASEEGTLNLRASISRQANTVSNEASITNDMATLTYRGSSGQPAEQNPILFAGQVRFVAKGASVSTDGSTVVIEGATVIDVFLDVETNYRYPEQDELDGQIDTKLKAAICKGYTKVRDEALADSSALLARASVNLGSSPSGVADLPTDERVLRAKEQDDGDGDEDIDVELITLAWNLARHFLVGSSRNTKAAVDFPANLQGVWNNRTSAAWGGKFTINMNTEMNYWPALGSDLLEAQEPLFDLMHLAQARGRVLARDMYGCAEGTVYHHNLDLWADPAPVDRWRQSSMWPMGAAWLVQHMLEHWRFTGDEAFLRDTAWPYLVDVAAFYHCYTFDWEGYRITGPSLSPEADYVIPEGLPDAGRLESNDINPSMDDQLLRDVFGGLLEAAEALGIDDDDDPAVSRARAFLPFIRPAQIGSRGQMLEWRAERRDGDPAHRHFSHLYGLHPGAQFSPLVNATLAAAARVSLDERIAAGSGSTGWSRTWAINLYARLFRGDDAWRMVRRWLAVYPTEGLWNTDHGASFQIDGNFALASGVTEMLVQSHAGAGLGVRHLVHLLPALPAAAVPRGSASGLTARGGFVVDLEWEDGALVTAAVTSRNGEELALRVADGEGDVLVNGEKYTEPIKTEKGATYTVTLA